MLIRLSKKKKLFLIFLINILFLFINLKLFKHIANTINEINLRKVRWKKTYEEILTLSENSWVEADFVVSSKLKISQNGSFLETETKKKNENSTLASDQRLKLIINDKVNCKLVLEGDKKELEKSKKLMKNKPKIPLFEEWYLSKTKNCESFKRERGYLNISLTQEEKHFPIAYSISTFRDLEQTERLLRAIYQPQNLYCIHGDIKSSLLFHKALRAISNCFENVWISSRLSKIKWGDASVILSEMNCLKDLLKRFRGKYKYFINLTGQEFPLRTNWQLVQILKLFNGSNDITGSSTRMEMERIEFKWSHEWSEEYKQTILYNTKEPKEPYPFANLTFFKGETHGFFSEEMTVYMLESFHGKKFYEWCQNTGHASEHYWNTLNYNSHLEAPGGYIGDLSLADHYSYHAINRAKNWVGVYKNQWPCNGKIVRGLCIFGLLDASWLIKRPEVFINKFHMFYEPIAFDCIEEWHRNQTIFKSNQHFNLNYYKTIPTILYSKK